MSTNTKLITIEDGYDHAKERQRKLLCEMMKDDAKSGLYDTGERSPLLSDDEIERYSMMYTIPSRYETARALKHAKGIYETARAKDAQLIQMLVDQVEACRVELCSAIPHLPRIGVKLATAREAECRSVLEAATAAGFKPSEP